MNISNEVANAFDIVIQTRFKHNQYYDKAYSWCFSNSLKNIGTWLHHTAHQKGADADFFIEYVLGRGYSFQRLPLEGDSSSFMGLFDVLAHLYEKESEREQELLRYINLFIELGDILSEDTLREGLKLEQKELNNIRILMSIYNSMDKDMTTDMWLNAHLDKLIEV
jgi:ferritin